MAERMNVGIIGGGRIAEVHARNLVKHFSKRVNVKGIFDSNPKWNSAWAAGLGIAIADNSEQILNDRNIHAILVCTSTNTHPEIIQAAARQKKAVFSEKPISQDPELTESTLAIVQQEGIPFQVGFNRIFDPRFAAVRERINNGEIGEPSQITIFSGDPEPPPKSYIKDSGGIFFDMSIHDWHMAAHLASQPIREVNVVSSSKRLPEYEGVRDVSAAETTLVFQNGARGVIFNDRYAGDRYPGLYDQRAEVTDSYGNTLTVDNPDATELNDDRSKPFFLVRYARSYVNEMRAFLDAVQNGTPTLVTGSDALQAELVAAAATQSLREGRAVRVRQSYFSTN